MLTLETLERQLLDHPLVAPRLATLRKAEELNPDFRNPHIVGGFLRNIALNKQPNDCDVVFQGKELNQPGVSEAVREAEHQLGVYYPDWEFENVSATGLSGDFYADTIGIHSWHTDYLTLILMGNEGKVLLGDEKTLQDLDERIYDLRFSGVEVWVNHRRKGHGYASCLIGDLIRCLYLCKSLDLAPSLISDFLLHHFDAIFSELTLDDQENRRGFWHKKSKGDTSYQPMLDRYNIKTLTTGV